MERIDPHGINSEAEQGRFSVAMDSARATYHGLRARQIEKGILGIGGLDRSERQQENAERQESFYLELGRTATQVIGEGVNLPPPLQPEPSQFDDVSSISAKRIERLNKVIAGEDPYEEKKPTLHDISRNKDLHPPALKWRERRTERKLEKTLRDIRQGRIDQKKARVMFANTGQKLWWGTKISKARDRFENWQSYRAGELDSFELVDKKRARKVSRVLTTGRPNEPGEERIVSPKVMIRRAKQLDRRSDGLSVGPFSVKRSIPQKIERRVSKAQRRQEKEVRKHEKLERKLNDHRQKQQGTIDHLSRG